MTNKILADAYSAGPMPVIVIGNSEERNMVASALRNYDEMLAGSGHLSDAPIRVLLSGLLDTLNAYPTFTAVTAYGTFDVDYGVNGTNCGATTYIALQMYGQRIAGYGFAASINGNALMEKRQEKAVTMLANILTEFGNVYAQFLATGQPASSVTKPRV